MLVAVAEGREQRILAEFPCLPLGDTEPFRKSSHVEGVIVGGFVIHTLDSRSDSSPRLACPRLCACLRRIRLL